MATRYYDRTLDCGCMYSSDAGGCLMPCNYGYGCGKEGCDEKNQCDECLKQNEKCQKNSEEWFKSDDYKEYNEECVEKNS